MANRWSVEEECLVADMWLNVHEFHSETVFWNTVTERFNNLSDGPFRSKSQITGKWARMNCECQKFNDIYLTVQDSDEVNGRLNTTLNMFRERYGGQGFKYLNVWFILKGIPIWNRYRD